MLKNVKKILVPVDFSDNSQKVFMAAVNVAEKFGAEIVCIFVVQSFEDYSGFFVPHMPVVQFQEEMQVSAQKKMSDFLEDNLPDGLAGSSKVVVGDVGEEIVAFAAQEKIDMIVMGHPRLQGPGARLVWQCRRASGENRILPGADRKPLSLGVLNFPALPRLACGSTVKARDGHGTPRSRSSSQWESMFS